jgi:hypothetical protein
MRLQFARKKRVPERTRPYLALVRLLTERSCVPEDHRPQAEHQRQAPKAKRHPCSATRRQPPQMRSRHQQKPSRSQQQLRSHIESQQLQ